jgi:hypothetical protein
MAKVNIALGGGLLTVAISSCSKVYCIEMAFVVIRSWLINKKHNDYLYTVPFLVSRTVNVKIIKLTNNTL